MRTANENKVFRAYGQVNQGTWCQETYETASRQAARRARQLRKAGYTVNVSSMGYQITSVGSIKMTMVDIRPGMNADTTDLPGEVEQVRFIYS